MITDTEIRIQGYKALAGALGNVQAERFITLIMREPFDYTKWQRNLFAGETVEAISKRAMNDRAGRKNTFRGRIGVSPGRIGVSPGLRT